MGTDKNIKLHIVTDIKVTDYHLVMIVYSFRIHCVKQFAILPVRRSMLFFKTQNLKYSQQVTQTARLHQTVKNEEKICIAYCQGESYKWDGIKNFIKSNPQYSQCVLPTDAQDVACISNNTGGNVFLFKRLGAFVCWDVADQEILSLKTALCMYVDGPYSNTFIDMGYETMDYMSTLQNTRLGSDRKIHLNCSETLTESSKVLEKLAFSNALALSVKLNMWEYLLQMFSDSIHDLPDRFKSGHSKIMSQKEVFRKAGELLSIIHETNLHSDLLDLPDFYWEREDLESYYSKTCKFLDMPQRTRVMNARLDHCSEVIEMLRSHASDQYSHRLEKLIILLIFVEVLFECVPYISDILNFLGLK